MKPLGTVRNVFAQTWLASQIRGAFGSTVPGPAPAPERKHTRRQRPQFGIEALEPRLLLSADVNYPDAGNLTDEFVTDLTLKIEDDGGLKIRLYETANLSNEVFESSILATENEINLSRFGPSATDGLFGDTIRIDMASLALLGPTGDALTITFEGGVQDVFADEIILSGNATLDFGLTITGNARITAPDDLTLTGGADLVLEVDITSEDLVPDAVSADADDYYANVDAVIDVSGHLSADDIALRATSTLSLDNGSLGLGSFHIALIAGFSDAAVNIGTGAEIDATGNLTVAAVSNVRAIASFQSDAGKTDTDTDAVVAVVGIESNAYARVSGNATIDVGGDIVLSADNVVIAGARADGSTGGAGATLGLAAIVSRTEASIAGTGVVAADTVAVTAGSENTLTSLAKSTSKGATDDGDGDPDTKTKSQEALADNDAATSDGDVSLAGAVAVGILDAETTAFVNSSGSVTITGLLDVTARSVNEAQTTADGGTTTIDGTNGTAVGIAVGIGVGLVENHAYVDGSGISAGSLNVRALMGQRDNVAFAQTDVDATAETISLLDGAHGLKTGDEVVYQQGAAATVIGGLANGTHYFVNVQDDGTVKLYDTAQHAEEGDADGLVLLTATGSASGHSFQVAAQQHRFTVEATSGASGGATGVAGALALGVMISDASATVRSDISVSGNVVITSENFAASSVKASGKQEGGGDLGIGISFALNVGETDTEAAIRNEADITGADDVTLSASSKNKMETTAEGGGAGATAVTPVFAISVSNNTTSASLGVLTGGTMTVGDDLSASASHEGSVKTVAEVPPRPAKPASASRWR
jgi:hypothetical protein